MNALVDAAVSRGQADVRGAARGADKLPALQPAAVDAVRKFERMLERVSPAD